MPVSRFLIPLVSTVWIFSVMGGMGMHVLAEQPTEVQAVRRQFSTLEEVTAVQVQEEGSTVRFLPGEGEEVCVRYADTTAEALYEIQVENGTLVVQKLKAPPPKVVTINGTIMQFEVDSAYDLEIVLPQRQYKSIEKLMTLLKQRKTQAIILLVSHDQKVLEQCDEVIDISDLRGN